MVRILTTKHLPVLELRLDNLCVVFSRFQRYGRESWAAGRRSRGVAAAHGAPWFPWFGFGAALMALWFTCFFWLLVAASSLD